MRRMHLLVRTSAIAALAIGIGLTACDTDRAIITEPTGLPVYDVLFGVDGSGKPAGTASLVDNLNGTGNVTVVTTNLEALASGGYQVWLGVAGTTTEGVDTVGQWAAVGPQFSDDSTLTITNSASVPGKNVVLVTIEPAATGTTPSDTRPLWRRNPTGTAGALSFGNFHPDVDSQFVWVATGRGTAGFRGLVVEAEDSALARPPRGYFYAGWLVNDSAETSLGAQTAPWPNRTLSLIDADITTYPGVVLAGPPPVLLAASSRFVGSGAAPFALFDDLIITLETKLGVADMSGTRVLTATVPGLVQDNDLDGLKNDADVCPDEAGSPPTGCP